MGASLEGNLVDRLRSAESWLLADGSASRDMGVGTSSFQVEIAPECSGYEGMGLIAVLIAIALWTFRRDFRFPRALVLVPVAMALMWVANALRITALVVLGSCGYRELAVGGFHSLAGWVLFLTVGLGLIACADRMPFFSRFQTDPGSAAKGSMLPICCPRWR